MIEPLRHALEHLDQLTPKEQEELATDIKALLERHGINAMRAPDDPRQELAGAFSRLADSTDEFAWLEYSRHEVPPSAPIDLDR